MHAALTQGCKNHLYFVFETIKYLHLIEIERKTDLNQFGFFYQRLNRHRHYHNILLRVQSMNPLTEKNNPIVCDCTFFFQS